MVKVGIPRALLFYYYSPMWKMFFKTLGANVIVSPETNKTILNEGVSHTIDEICLPVKIFNGHVANLKDRVDYLFIPRIISIANMQWICPKFQGLPEIVRFSFDSLPTILSPIIDYNKSSKDTIYEVGKVFTDNKKLIKSAYLSGLNDYYYYENLIKKYQVIPMDIVNNLGYYANISRYNKPKILVLGHPYVIYDKYLSMNVIEKLRGFNFKVITEDNISDEVINNKLAEAKIDMYWTFGRKILGSALHCIDNKTIDGIVYISSFSCGLDSVITEILERRIKRVSSIPYTLITIDEHTGEAGINTRLEAFYDMIKRGDQVEDNISSLR